MTRWAACPPFLLMCERLGIALPGLHTRGEPPSRPNTCSLPRLDKVVRGALRRPWRPGPPSTSSTARRSSARTPTASRGRRTAGQHRPPPGQPRVTASSTCSTRRRRRPLPSCTRCSRPGASRGRRGGDGALRGLGDRHRTLPVLEHHAGRAPSWRRSCRSRGGCPLRLPAGLREHAPAQAAAC